MAYTRQTWTSGDVITAEKLNHIEEGINNSGSSALVISANESNNIITLDKTWQQIYDAFPNCYISHSTEEKEAIISVKIDSGGYRVETTSDGYVCQTPDAYPTFEEIA